MGARMGWVKSLGKDQIASPEVFGAFFCPCRAFDLSELICDLKQTQSWSMAIPRPIP